MTTISDSARKAAVLPSEVGEVIANRNGTHGDPIENHDHIADLWTAYLGDVLGRPLTGDEVADMMILLKLSRKHVGGMHVDHYRDTIGYAAIAALYVPGYDPEEELLASAYRDASTDGGDDVDPLYEAAYRELTGRD